MVSVHNAYIIAKDSNTDYVQRTWPGFKGFVEDLVDDLTYGVQTRRQPSIMLQPHPGNQLHTLYTRPDGLYKVCNECSLQGKQKKTTTKMCNVCQAPIDVKCLQKHQERMLVG
ncbi:hypothetical protein ElyMa_003316300 [Elysia marginata]|uniref:PiggyBac transposable element-derived protein domain-containing protein n=1 Tax=Elysia marginata TaxID=1093978 RepID=A0AAV4JD49_9GAST|nr:hypothetical protein ElyMa_003316300 [Elysia marginata]